MDTKTYFLRQGKRITGPFPMLKLTAMYRSGLLSCEDMCSEDKCKWHYIDMLFPDLAPDVPHVLEVPAAGNTSASPAVNPGETVATPAATPDVTVKITFPPPAAGETEKKPRTLREHAYEWFVDTGRTFALLWNFQEMLQKHAGKSARFYGISLTIHILLSFILIVLFGRYYSSRYHHLLSPVMGISLVVVLFAAASLIGWFAAKYAAPEGQKPAPDWKLCAAGILMDYGTIACCIMALAHGAQHLWVILLLCFINSAIVCSSAMQLRDYLEAGGKNWKVPVIYAVLLLNPVLAAIIYCFIKLI